MESQLVGVDVVYHAIGRFVVAFSYFHSTTELMVVHLLSPTRTESDQKRAWAVISGGTTQPVVDALFALCREIKGDEWSEADFHVITSVRKDIQRLISERNRIAHDVWSLGHPNRPLPEGSDAERVRFSSSPAKGTAVSGTPVTVADLNLLTEDADRLRAVVRQIGALALSSSVGTPASDLEVFGGSKVRVREREGDTE